MGRTEIRISWRGETSHPTAPSWVHLPTHSRSQSMAKATSQSYALRPESSVTVQQPVPVKWGLVDYKGGCLARFHALARLTPLVSTVRHAGDIGTCWRSCHHF